MPRDDNPDPKKDIPMTNELKQYYKDLDKKDKEHEVLKKIEQKKKELDIEVIPIYISFNEFKKPSSVILENVGNSTYMSCVLQCLVNIQSIAKYYLKELNTIKNHLNEIPFSYVFSRIIFQLYSYLPSNLKQSISLSNFHKCVVSLHPEFAENSTQYAVNFLIAFLDTLNDEDKQLHKNNNINNTSEETKSGPYKDSKEYIKYLKENENSIIFNDFGWVNQKIKKCEQCKSESVIYQIYFTFDLNLENSLQNAKLDNKDEISVYECIERYCQKRQLYSVYCEVCKNQTPSELESLILVSPKYFIFILDEDKMKELKNNNIKFRIDPYFDLSYVIKDYSMNYNYELIGMVVYELLYNNNIEYKEYNAYCLSYFDNNWYKYEKEKISKVNIVPLLESKNLNPVILFYRIKENKKINNY